MSSEVERIATRIVERLAGSDSVLRHELATLVVDRLFARRTRDVLQFERLSEVLTPLLSADNLRRAIEQHVEPGYRRHAQVVRADGVRVGAVVGPLAHQKLHTLVRALRVPEARWTQHGFDAALVRRLLGPVWTQVLVGFAKRLPVPGVAAGSRGAPQGITGFLTRSVQEQAEKLIDRGRSVMGGLGAEFERRLTATARDFSDGAAHAFRVALHERLHSEEGRELLGQLLAGFVDHVLRTELAALQQDLDALPVAELFDLAPDLIAHAAQSPFVAELARRELGAWLEAHGDRGLGELLAEYSALEPTRGLLVADLAGLVAELALTPAFADWAQRLVQPDGNE